MPAVVLIGDSIRMGYQDTVRRELAGAAQVWAPEENGAHTVNVLVHLVPWVFARKPDLVHVGAGLHDLKTVAFGERENLVPLEGYRRNVRLILRLVRERAGAQVIWATTTPVQEAKHNAAHANWKDFQRYAADVAAYNEAARAVCGELGVPVNDLYAVATEAGLERVQAPDGVHFTAEGYALLGRAVAASCRAALGA
jgi:lysophospholipase L1-like esterase